VDMTGRPASMVDHTTSVREIPNENRLNGEE